MAEANVREYSAQARSMETFGRVLCSARNHHFVVDGPIQNGCPGEAVTPGELFLAGIASCGVELVQVLAREQGVPLQTIGVTIKGTLDRSNPVRRDLTLFNTIRLEFHLSGVTETEGTQLVETFRGR
jgi:uncharacterized OsmC-like protein